MLGFMDIGGGLRDIYGAGVLTPVLRKKSALTAAMEFRRERQIF